jgi:predicted RND superfamily exporter protein
MIWLAQLSMDRPRAVLAIVAFATGMLGLGVLRLELRTDGDALMPEGNAVVERTLRDRDRFRDPRFVLLVVDPKSADVEVASPEGFERLRIIDRAVRRLDVLQTAGMLSLASLPRLTRGDGQVALGTHIEDMPEDPAGFARRLAEIRAQPGVDGLLLSPDGRRALFWLPLSEAVGVEEAVDALERLCVELRDDEFDLLLGGPLMAETLLGAKVLEDLAILVPLMIVVMSVLLFTMLRSPGGVMIPMIETAVVLIWTFGAMGWAGVPIALVTTILPVVLMAMCITDEIHLLERLIAHWRIGDMRARLDAAFGDVARPIVLTSLTTAFGFLSFMSASIVPLREFGLFAAFGILTAMALTFTFIPALIMMMPDGSFGHGRRVGAGRGLVAFAGYAARHPGRCFGIGIAALALMLPGVARLRVSDSWVDNFDPDAELVRAERAINASFWGSYRLDVVFDAADGFFRDPPGVELMESFRELAAHAPNVGGTETYLDALEPLAKVLGAEGPLSTLPAGQVWDLFTLAELSEGRAGLDRLMASSQNAVRARLYVQSPDYARAQELIHFLDDQLPDLVGPTIAEAHYSGDLPVATALVESIVYNQLRSIGWALTTIAVLILLFSRRLSSLIAIVPVIAATSALFGIMGLFGIELGIATSMFASLAVGVGVDFGIHFMHRFERRLLAGDGFAEAIHTTFGQAGRALFWNATVLSAGFSVLIASTLRPNHTLGLLLAAATLGCYAATFLLLPRLLRFHTPGPRAASAAVALLLVVVAAPIHAKAIDCDGVVADERATELMTRLERAQRDTARIVRMQIATLYPEGSRLAAAFDQPPSPKTLWGVFDGNAAATRILYVFTGPGRMAGTSLLIRDVYGSYDDDSTWFYLRAFGHFEKLSGAIERAIVPGTSLSYEDARGYVTGSKYRFRFIGEPEQESARVLGCPRTPELADRLGYSALLIDAEPARSLIRRIEYRGLGGKPLKRYSVTETVNVGGLDRPARGALEQIVQGYGNEIVYEYWLPREALKDALFAPDLAEGSFLSRIRKLLHDNGLGERIDSEIAASDKTVREYDEKWKRKRAPKREESP